MSAIIAFLQNHANGCDYYSLQPCSCGKEQAIDELLQLRSDNARLLKDLVEERDYLIKTILRLQEEKEKLLNQLVEAETLLTEYIATYGEFDRE